MSVNENEKQNTDETIPFRQKLSYALGSIPGMFFGTFLGQIQTFYYAWMYLDTKWIIVAQIFYAIWNLINDPIFGYLEDKTRTKAGRYMPWVKLSAPLLSIGFVLIFLPPSNLRVADSVFFSTTQITLFFWYLITQVIYDTGYF